MTGQPTKRYRFTAADKVAVDIIETPHSRHWRACGELVAVAGIAKKEIANRYYRRVSAVRIDPQLKWAAVSLWKENENGI